MEREENQSMNTEELQARAQKHWRVLSHQERESLTLGVLLEIADECGAYELSEKGKHVELAFEEDFLDLPKKVQEKLVQAVEETGFRGDLFRDLPNP